MPEFKYKQTRAMTPRPGTKYSTTYYRQSTQEYRRLRAHVEQVINEILDQAILTNQIELLEQELKGFPRTHGARNYSAGDILIDMQTQLAQSKDIASGILGRWQRLFEDFPQVQILLVEEPTKDTNFPEIFTQT
jgi:hypothetical protein